jgi:hypothetical protein
LGLVAGWSASRSRAFVNAQYSIASPLLRRFSVAKSHGGGVFSVPPRRAVETHRNSTRYLNFLLKYLLFRWWIVKKIFVCYLTNAIRSDIRNLICDVTTKAVSRSLACGLSYTCNREIRSALSNWIRFVRPIER